MIRRASVMFFAASLVLCLAGVAKGRGVLTGDLIFPVFDGSERHVGDGIQGTIPSASPGDTMGWTYYDQQHNGTIGKQIVADEAGDVRFSWMCATDAILGNRHVHYNYWVADSEFQWPGNPPPGGVQVDDLYMAGFTDCDLLSDGRAVVAFHERFEPGNLIHTAVAVEVVPGIGVFDVTAVDTFTWPPSSDSCPIWPKVAVDIGDNIHVVATGLTWPTHPLCYSRSTDQGVTWEPWWLVEHGDSIYDISYTVQSSRTSGKVGIAYTAPREGIDPRYKGQWADDLYYWQSSNYGASWQGPFNITQFAEWDSMRLYTDCALIFDDQDQPHFAATAYKAEGDSAIYTWYSMIIHVDSERNLSRVSGWGWPPDSLNGWWFMSSDAGAWRLPADKPNLSVTRDGNLLCIFVGNRDEDMSAGGYPNGEIYIAQSNDGGLIWEWDGIADSVWNITQSPTPGAIPGECDDDDYPSIAEVSPTIVVGEDTLTLARIIYVNDKDAGAVPHEEGTATNNPVLFITLGEPIDSVSCEFSHFPGWVPKTGTLNFAMTWINPLPDPLMVDGQFEIWKGTTLKKTIPYASFELPSGSKICNFVLGPVPKLTPPAVYTIINNFTADGFSCQCKEQFEIVPVGWIDGGW